MEVVSKEKNKIVLRIKGVGAAYINALRRYMMTEVPVLAIEDVEFRKNSSALYDEIVAHRLGMLSIKTDAKTYNLPSECKCKGAGCAQCQVKLTLNVTGPKMIYAEDFKSTDPKIKPVHDKTPIVRLLEGQELELEATATMGTGREHAKWNTGLIYYKEYPHMKIKSQPENAKALAAKYSQVLELKAGKLSIKENELANYDLAEGIVAESNGAITVDYKDDYLFTIESWEQLSPKEIFTIAIERFDKELNEVKALI